MLSSLHSRRDGMEGATKRCTHGRLPGASSWKLASDIHMVTSRAIQAVFGTVYLSYNR